jgi:hypothetical protein
MLSKLNKYSKPGLTNHFNLSRSPKLSILIKRVPIPQSYRTSTFLAVSTLSTHHSPLTTHHSPLITHHSSLITHHSSLITHHSSLITHHSSLITHHSSSMMFPAWKQSARTNVVSRAPFDAATSQFPN